MNLKIFSALGLLVTLLGSRTPATQTEYGTSDTCRSTHEVNQGDPYVESKSVDLDCDEHVHRQLYAGPQGPFNRTT